MLYLADRWPFSEPVTQFIVDHVALPLDLHCSVLRLWISSGGPDTLLYNTSRGKESFSSLKIRKSEINVRNRLKLRTIIYGPPEDNNVKIFLFSVPLGLFDFILFSYSALIPGP